MVIAHNSLAHVLVGIPPLRVATFVLFRFFVHDLTCRDIVIVHRPDGYEYLEVVGVISMLWGILVMALLGQRLRGVKVYRMKALVPRFLIYPLNVVKIRL